MSPTHSARRRALGAALGVTAVLLTGCGGGEADAPERPLVDQIAPAMAAVDAERGGPQDYFEVNATPQVVNLFVATEGATMVVPYVYVGSELGTPGNPAAAEGATFQAAAVTFDPATILDGITADLPDSDLVLFTIAGTEAGGVQYGAGVRSREGGSLDVLLGPDGSVQSVDAGS